MYKIYGLYSGRSFTDIRYIGITKQKLSRRLTGHVSAAKKDRIKKIFVWRSHVYNWINKELEDNFKIYIKLLEKGIPEHRAIHKERYYILMYRSLGYNLTNIESGGNGCVGFKFKNTTSEEHAEKIRLKRIGSKRTEEQVLRNKLAQINSTRSKATRKEVCCYDLYNNLITEYSSARDAARTLRPNLKISNASSAIRRCLKEKIKTAYGYVWKYKQYNQY